MCKITSKDQKLLSSLDFNASAPLSTLAKQCHIKRETLEYRLKRLEAYGIINGYYVVLNTPKLGMMSYKVMIKYQSVSSELEDKILEELASMDEVGWIVKTEGCYDLMFVIWAKNDILLGKTLKHFFDKFSAYFYTKDVLILTENRAYKRDYFIKENSNELHQKECVVYNGEPKNICDNVDAQIIYHLSKNARVKITTLAKNIGLSPEAIRHRIKKLIKNNVILAFRPKINLPKLGYLYYNILLDIQDTSSIDTIKKYCDVKPHITYFVKYIGKYDLGIEIEVKTHERFREIREEIRDRFGNKIRNYDFVRILDEVKITYGPPKHI